MSSPKISVIIPTFNRKQKTLRAVESVLAQSYQKIELIIVDDGSQDGTGDLLMKTYADKIFYLKQENSGVSRARNYGVDQSCGEWIAFLDSDDYWQSDKLTRQMAFHEENKNMEISQTQEIWIRNGKRVNQRRKHSKPRGWIFDESLRFCTISPSSVILKKSLFMKVGGFDEKLRACEDYDLWLFITANHPVGLLDQQLLTKTGGHVDQLSGNYPVMDRFRIYSLLKALSLYNLSGDQTLKVTETLKEKVSIILQGKKKRGSDPKNLESLIEDTRLNHSFQKNQTALYEALLCDGWSD